MSVQLLDRTRKINQLLQNSAVNRVIFSEICTELGKILSGRVLVISRKGKILGEDSLSDGTEAGERDGILLKGKVGTFVDPMLNERLLLVLSTKENVNLETLGFTEEESGGRQAVVSPICIAGERLGTLCISRQGAPFDIDDIIICEYASTVIGMSMRHSVNEEYAEEARRIQVVRSAASTLSFSEMEAMKHIFGELKGSEGILVASKIADKIGITRSVIVNALRKFESAGIIESRSSGMRGTYIKVLNTAVFDEMDRIRNSRKE